LTLGLEGSVDPKFRAELPLLQFRHSLLLSLHLGRWCDGPHHPHLQREVAGLHILQDSAGEGSILCILPLPGWETLSSERDGLFLIGVD